MQEEQEVKERGEQGEKEREEKEEKEREEQEKKEKEEKDQKEKKEKEEKEQKEREEQEKKEKEEKERKERGEKEKKEKEQKEQKEREEKEKKEKEEKEKREQEEKEKKQKEENEQQEEEERYEEAEGDGYWEDSEGVPDGWLVFHSPDEGEDPWHLKMWVSRDDVAVKRFIVRRNPPLPMAKYVARLLCTKSGRARLKAHKVAAAVHAAAAAVLSAKADEWGRAQRGYKKALGEYEAAKAAIVGHNFGMGKVGKGAQKKYFDSIKALEKARDNVIQAKANTSGYFAAKQPVPKPVVNTLGSPEYWAATGTGGGGDTLHAVVLGLVGDGSGGLGSGVVLDLANSDLGKSCAELLSKKGIGKAHVHSGGSAMQRNCMYAAAQGVNLLMRADPQSWASNPPPSSALAVSTAAARQWMTDTEHYVGQVRGQGVRFRTFLKQAATRLGELCLWQKGGPQRYAAIPWDVAVLLLAQRTQDLSEGDKGPFSGWSSQGANGLPYPLRFVGARTVYDYVTGSARRPAGWMGRGAEIVVIIDHPDCQVSRGPRGRSSSSSSSSSTPAKKPKHGQQ